MSTHSIFSNEIAVFQLETWGKFQRLVQFVLPIQAAVPSGLKSESIETAVTSVMSRARGHHRPSKRAKRRNQKLLEHS